jgi:hypothetical protein
MKKLNLLFAFCILLLSFSQAQTPPNTFNYSAVARNVAGQPIASSSIGIQISILKTSTTGAVQYSENHIVNTDAFGLFNLAIGLGTVQSGSMSAIKWGIDNYYIKIGMDATGGTNFLTMGTTQLMSVPYAMHAKTAETLVSGGTNTVGKTYIELFGDITNAQADSTLKADLGPNTQFVYITNTTKLTSIDLSSIKALMELSITANEVLTTVNASSLTRCTKNFDISTNPLLATIQTDKITFLGDVNISKNAKLTAINFPLLKKARNIYVDENPIISNFSAVLLTIANEVDIDDNNSLTSINFSALTTLSESLDINDNALLSTLNISSLKTASSIRLSGNGLTSLSFSALTTLSGSLDINHNISLSSLITSSLISTGDISIRSNGITSISFPALTTLNGQLGITDNASLTSLTSSSLNSVKGIYIENNGLTSISFPALTTINGQLYISNNASLTSITASSLNTAKGINIQKNGVTSLNFPALKTNDGSFDISNNASMTSLSFPALTTINGQLSISDNASLTSLTSNSLITVGNLNFYYSIRIENNGLTSLSFPALTTLNGGLSVLTNPSLVTVSFSELTTLNGRLDISTNVSMTTLSFPALTTTKSGESFYISSNILLNTLNISSLSKMPSFDVYQCKLSNITWAPQITSWTSINLNSNALPSSEINKILALVVAAGQSAHSGTSGLSLSQTPPAPPTGQGITDKATIKGWGIYVSTDN